MAVRGEIDVIQPVPRLVQGLAKRQRDQFQVGKQTLGFGLGKDGEQMVLLWAMGIRRVGHSGHEQPPETFYKPNVPLWYDWVKTRRRCSHGNARKP